VPNRDGGREVFGAQTPDKLLSFAAPVMNLGLTEAFCWRGDFCNEIAHNCFVGQRFKRHLARLKSTSAGVNGSAVELYHAFFAGVGIDAGKANC
jgi:hypothetical protein